MKKNLPAKTSSAAPAVTPEATNIFQVIARAAADPQVNVEKMQALLSMQKDIMQEQAKINYNKAMARMQKKLPRIHKKGLIEFIDKRGQKRETPFARYEDVDAAIRPIMIKEGFSISFCSEWGTAGAKIIGILCHEEGFQRQAEIRLPLDTSGSKNELQAMGSTISYGKRYLVGMLLNIVTVDEDDDGVKGGGAPVASRNDFADRVKKQTGDAPAAGAPGESAGEENPAGADLASDTFHVNIEGKHSGKYFNNPTAAGKYLRAVMEKRNHKKSRADLIAENAELLRAIDGAGNEEFVRELHALADQGV